MFEDQLVPGYVLRTYGFRAKDDQGGFVEVPNNTPFNGAIRLLRASEQTVNARKGMTASHRIYAKPAIIPEDNSVIVFEGNEYDVVFWNNVMRADELLQIDVVLRKQS